MRGPSGWCLAAVLALALALGQVAETLGCVQGCYIVLTKNSYNVNGIANDWTFSVDNATPDSAPPGMWTVTPTGGTWKQVKDATCTRWDTAANWDCTLPNVFPQSATGFGVRFNAAPNQNVYTCVVDI